MKYNFTKPFMESIILNDIKEAMDSIKEEKEVSVSEEESKRVIDKNNEIIYATDYHTKEMQELVTTGKNYQDKNNFIEKDQRNSKHFFQQDLNNPIKIKGEHSLEESINMIAAIGSQIGNSFFGAIIVDDKNKKINPLNPIVASEIIKAIEEFSKRRYTVIVFSLKNSDWKPNPDYMKKAVHNNNLILSSYINRLKPTFNMVESSTNIAALTKEIKNSGDAEIWAKYETNITSDKKGEIHYVVPLQLLTYGFAVPAYGASLVKLNNNGSNQVGGTPLSPFGSCNISSTWLNRDTKKQRDSASFNSVCTGNQSGTSQKGLKSITHSNLSSPYNSDCLTAGYLEFAKASIDISFIFYKSLLHPDNQAKVFGTPSEKIPKVDYWESDKNTLREWDDEPNPLSAGFYQYCVVYLQGVRKISAMQSVKDYRAKCTELKKIIEKEGN